MGSYVSMAEREQQILLALGASPATADQLAADLGVTRPWVTRILGRLHREKRVHVLNYKRSEKARGPWAAIYAAGEGEDAPVPPRMSSADYQRERRARLRAEQAGS